MKGIIVREPWISKILRGEKTWEMRSTRAKYRGLVALIRKGSGHVFGVANLVDSRPPLTPQNYAEYKDLHGIGPADQKDAIAGEWIYPWVLADVRPLSSPVKYQHNGGVAWVTLSDEESRRVLEQVGSRSE